MTIQPRVVDISHHNKVTDLKATAAAGAWGVIHKASQGRGYRDPDYAARRQQAVAAGLLWGAYHFNDGSDVAGQVDWFLECASPDEQTLLVLDFEDNPKSNMSPQQAVQFLRLIEQKTGRKAAIYSGNRLKETIGKLSAADRSYVCEHRLWLCQYGPRAVLPAGFERYWLWQYTGDGVGQPPHAIPGIVAGNGGLDLNIYDGTREQLAAEWAPSSSLVPGILSVVSGEGVSAHAAQAAADQVDDSPAIAPALDPDMVGDPYLYSVQKRLKGRNYSPGLLDGKWGGGTSGAISAFRNDSGLTFAMPTSLVEFHGIKDELGAELQRWEDAGRLRPVTAARANVDPGIVAAVAPEVVPVKQNRTLTIWGAICTFAAGICKTFNDTISNAWDFVSGHKDQLPTDPGTLQKAWDFVSGLPSEIWMFAGAIGFTFIAVRLHGAIQKINEDVKTGARQ